jgi:hypothetical protein
LFSKLKDHHQLHHLATTLSPFYNPRVKQSEFNAPLSAAAAESVEASTAEAKAKARTANAILPGIPFLNSSWFKLLVALIVLLMAGDFIFGGIVPSFTTGKNDFSDPYVGSWLWAHGQNPYDSTLVTATANRLTHSSLPVIPIYPLTTYLLIAPLSVLPWSWASLAWTLTSAAAIGLILWTLLQIARFKATDPGAWLLAALVFGFAPLHRALHVENAAIIAVAFCLLAVHLANNSGDLSAGLLLAIATGLKPQLGFWILVFYLVQLRWRVVATGFFGFAALLIAAYARIPLPLSTLLASYRDDLHYWFGPAGPNDFRAGNPLRFQLVNSQVIFWQWFHSATIANIVAHALFALGLAIWMWAVTRGRLRSPSLALTALLALSFLSIYHSVTDVSMLILGYCWVLGASDGQLDVQLQRTKMYVFILLLGLSLPIHSFLMRLEPHLSQAATASWWWTGIVAPSFIWNVVLLNLFLLVAMRRSVASA